MILLCVWINKNKLELIRKIKINEDYVNIIADISIILNIIFNSKRVNKNKEIKNFQCFSKKLF